jgi:hypothetical protein
MRQSIIFRASFYYTEVICQLKYSPLVHTLQGPKVTKWLIYAYSRCLHIYKVIHKSLQDVRPLRYSSRDGHAEGEHVNRGRDTPISCPNLQVLDMFFLLCLSWLMRCRVRKIRRDL